MMMLDSGLLFEPPCSNTTAEMSLRGV